MKHLKEKVMNAKAGRNLKVLFITGLCLALLAAVEQLQAISRAESLFAGQCRLHWKQSCAVWLSSAFHPGKSDWGKTVFRSGCHCTSDLHQHHNLDLAGSSKSKVSCSALGLLCHLFSYLRPDSLCHCAVCAEKEMP